MGGITVLVENVDDENYKKTERSKILADMFAAELLMPEEDVIKEYNRLLKKNKLEKPNEGIIVILQQQYFVEYKAITKRLKEIEQLEFDEVTEAELNRILNSNNELLKLTLKLGYSNKLNLPSERKVYLPKQILKMIEDNYSNNNTTLDDLTVLFGYCDLSPHEFGYEEDDLSDEARALEAKLRAELGE